MSCNAVTFSGWLLLLGSLSLMSLTEAVQADLPVRPEFTNKEAAQNKTQALPTLNTLHIGWDGKYRVGSPVEVRATLSWQKRIQGVVYFLIQDADGNEVRYGPIHNSYSSENDYRQLITAPRAPFQVTVELRILPLGDSEVQQLIYQKKDFTTYPVDASWTRSGIAADAIPSTREAWLELGPSLNLRGIAALNARDANLQPVIVSVPNYNQQPMDYRGFLGIVLTSPLVPGARHNTHPQNDFADLKNWVRQGGSLFVTVYESGNEYARSEIINRFWNELLPGQYTGNRVPHQQFSAWENFLGTEEPLPINEELRRNPPLIPVLSDIRGKVLLREGDTPLVIEHQLGLGRVVTCLVDLNAEPWRSWKKRDELLQRLIPWHITTEAEAKFASSGSSQRLGYDDLAGQFVTALGTFQGVRRTPFWVFMSAALGFGLVWYFVQSMLLKTWRAPARLVMAAFVVTAATLGFALLTGGFVGEARLIANSAQVVDYNAMQGEYQGQSWLSVLSSNSRQIDLQASVATSPSAKPADLEQQLEWLGMPGKGWGGLDASLATWTQGGEPYQIDSRAAAVTGLTLSPDLTKSFHERWRQPTEVLPTTPLVSRTGESLPRGTLKSELPFALQDAIFLYDTWGVELGTVQPGQIIDIDQIRGRVASAGTIITGKRIKPTEAVQSYDRSNTNVPEILKLLLLNRAAGGTRYTGLFSRAWPLLDQTSSLTSTQALILGTGPAPVKWKIGPHGEPLEALEPVSEVCWYRLWLPVISNEESNGTGNKPTVIRLPAK
jgi:hypothetical protein